MFFLDFDWLILDTKLHKIKNPKVKTFYNKKAVLPQGNRAMPQVFFSVEVRQQHSLQVHV